MKKTGKAARKGGGNKEAEVLEGGMKKQFLKSRPACRVTFRLPKEAALNARQVTIVGYFNNWDHGATPMKKLKEGDFTVIMELECNREYRYKYLVDGMRWENDWHADRYEPNPYGGEDSIISI